MNKLTKEQRDWLIASIQNEENKFTGGCNGCNSKIGMMNVFDVINQCTEKEFPEFEISLGVPWSVRLRNAGGITWIDTLKDGIVKQSSLSFEVEEFKQFTESCNKIVEWYLDD